MTYAYPIQSPADLPRERTFGDKLFLAIGVLLAGYAMAGRGFAYLGFPPLFVGEALLAAGFCYLLTCPARVVGRAIGLMLPALLLAAWCARRAATDFSTHGVDTIRDAAIFYYAGYGLVIVALLLEKPTRLVDTLAAYRRYLVVFLTLGMVFAGMSRLLQSIMPGLPWAPGVALISVRPGDTAVHLSGAFAFIVLFGGVPVMLAAIMIPIGMAFAVSSRAAMFSFLAPSALLGLYRPLARAGWALLSMAIVFLFIAWGFDVKIKTSTYEGRDFSVDTLIDSVASVVSDDAKTSGAMEETKSWRLKWWTKIFAYTWSGEYFWTGKGFGINLADDDGFQVHEDSSLRSPHNGHLTYLARAGVPGFALWIAAQLYLVVRLIDGLVRASGDAMAAWRRLFFFLLLYWLAFMINASFDVFLEGPMGGVWYWSLYGFAIGATAVMRERPELLSDER